MLDTLKVIGANSVVMSASEVFNGMRIDAIDGMENNSPTFVVHSYLSVVKNCTQSRHSITPELFLFSKAKWNKLKKEDRDLIIKLAKGAQIEQQKLWHDYNVKSLETTKANSVQFRDTDTGCFYKATQSVRDNCGKDHQDSIKHIQDMK